MKGFTLIELLLATLIFTMIGMLTYSSIYATFKTKRTVSEKTALQEIGTSILHKIRDDLTQTFYVQSPKPLTFFKGEDNQTHDRISFTSLAHSPSMANARESDQTEITYMTESHPQKPKFFLLKRKEMPRIDEVQDDTGDFATLSEDIVEFNLEYYDGAAYKQTWDTQSPENLHKLPSVIRISLRLQDDKEREEVFETLVDLPMSEDLGIIPAAAPATSPNPSPTPTVVPTP